MNDITLDAIIRRYLAVNRLPLHYYVPMLVIAKQGLDEMHFDTLQKVKYVTINVTAGFEVPLPNDYVEAVAVGVEVGDKVKNIGYDRKLNKRDNSGNAFEEAADQYYSGLSLSNSGLFIENYFNEYGNYNGKLFGRNIVWSDSYTINRDLGIIRINNKSDITTIHLMYLSLPEKVSNKSVIHPFAQRALLEFITWQKSRAFKEGNVIAYNEKQFYNEYRKLRARLNKLTTVEIKRAIRRGVNLAIKN